MRILVLSDSHRDEFTLKLAIKSQPSADVVVFLGDGEDDFDNSRNLIRTPRVYAVKGNNDWYSALPQSQIIEAGGVRTYLTHGHGEAVKYGTGVLLDKVKGYDCTLGLYGHTHEAKYEYFDGIHLFCPGSILHGDYGVVDITDKGIMCINMKCNL